MLSLNFDFNMMGIWVGEKGQLLWALDAFAEDQNWVPSTPVQQLKTILTPDPGKTIVMAVIITISSC